VKLDTNGSMPGKIKSLIDKGLVDYVAMDIKTDPFHYDPIIRRAHNPDDILLSIQVIMDSAQAYEFRTTCVKGFVDEHVIYTIAQIIKGAKRYALQAFQSENVLHPEFFQNADYHYDNNDLLHLKSIADPYVEECIIR
jgi:pyruvate formate lyase activating enzyme